MHWCDGLHFNYYRPLFFFITKNIYWEGDNAVEEFIKEKKNNKIEMFKIYLADTVIEGLYLVVKPVKIIKFDFIFACLW